MNVRGHAPYNVFEYLHGYGRSHVTLPWLPQIVSSDSRNRNGVLDNV